MEGVRGQVEPARVGPVCWWGLTGAVRPQARSLGYPTREGPSAWQAETSERHVRLSAASCGHGTGIEAHTLVARYGQPGKPWGNSCGTRVDVMLGKGF